MNFVRQKLNETIFSDTRKRKRRISDTRKKTRAKSYDKDRTTKRKRGRPPGRPKTRVNLYLGTEVVEPFKKYCADLGISASDGVTRLIENVLISKKRSEKAFSPVKIKRKKKA